MREYAKFSVLLFIVSATYSPINGQQKVSQIDKSDVNALKQEIHNIAVELSKISADTFSQKVNSTFLETNVQLEVIASKLDSLNTLSQPQSKWWDFYPNMYAEMAGAFLGAFATILVFYLTILADRKKENERREEEQRQNNSYLGSIIHKTLLKIKSQSEYLKEHYEETRKKPVELHLMTFIPLQDLKRLALLLEQEKYYHSYLHEFGKTQENVTKFSSITSSVDFLSDIVRQITTETLPNAQRFDHERKKRYQLLLDDGMDFAVEIAKQAEQQLPELADLIFTHVNYFHQNFAGTDDLDSVQEQYVNSLKNQLAKRFSDIPVVRELLGKLRELTYLHTDIVAQNGHHADIMANDYKNIIAAIRMLEESAQEAIEKNMA